jgi:hypothetical protein
MIDHDEGAVDTDAGEHGREERGFVFAVAVAVAEDIAGEVGLIAADPHLDYEVADLFLDKLGDGFGLIVEVGLAGGEFLGFGCDLRRCSETIFGEVLIPLANALPGTVGWSGNTRSTVVNRHATGKGEL